MASRIPAVALITVLSLLPAGGALAAPPAAHPEIAHPHAHDTSPALRDMPAQPATAGPKFTAKRFRRLPPSRFPRGPMTPDPVLQSTPGAVLAPSTTTNFEGTASVEQSATIGWVLPPDTNGAIGRTHYVQVVNVVLSIFQRDGLRVYGPVPINTLWQGFGQTCGVSNDGDPIVLYDHLADRWLISQLAIPNFPSGPFYQCIAVSTSGDPLGTYHRYEYVISATKLNDYPKFGVWPDGYYYSVNQFDNCRDELPPFGLIVCDWAGPRVAVFERSQMLNGAPARMVAFEKSPANLGGLLPSSLDGPAPPAGTPNFFTQVDDGAWFNPPVADRLQVWGFQVDWTLDPPAASFGPSSASDPDVSAVVLPTAAFDSNMCDYQTNCIPQPGQDFFGFPSPAVDALADRLMHRLQYRSFPTHDSIVANHTVDVGVNHAGVRWYELRKDTAGTWTIHQQGTYAPNDGDHRWMGSIAMDQAGNIALGYSVSSETTWPSIRYVTRTPVDPLGEMGGEASIVAGSGAQLDSSGRWGDYSAMSVDPLDDCTFWYTQEYYAELEFFFGRNWRTRIASFKLPSCGAPPPSISISDVTVTEGNTGTVSAAFTVSLSTATSAVVTVDYATADGSATAGSDYVAAAGTLTFAPGTTTQVVTVTVNGDTLVEGDETFVVNLSNAVGATIADAQGVGTILNDDAPPPVPSISISDVTVTEGNTGTVSAAFTVSLSTATSAVVTVDYATADGTATAGSDYVAAAGTLTFAPGTTTQVVTVTVNGDTLVEGDETFAVSLSNAVGATIADAQGVGTIRNDDSAPPAGTITVLDPNGGENWREGQSRNIQWTSSGVVGNVRIDLARDGVNFTETIAGATANDGVDRWKVTGPATTSARIRVCTTDLAVCDTSNATFRIR